MSPAASRPLLKAVGIFLILAAGLTGILELLEDHREELLQLQADVLVEQVAPRLEDHVRTRLEVIELLGREWEREDGLARPTFETQAALLQERFGGYQAINWVDAEGVIRWVFPREPNLGAENRAVADDPRSAPAVAAARRSEGMHLTGPVELFQGGLGIVGYVALRDEAGSVEGFVSGVFRVDNLVEAALGDGVFEGFSVRVDDGDRTVFSRGDVDAPGGAPYTATAGASVGDRTWRVSLVPRPETVRAVVGGHDALLMTGLFIAGLAAVLFWVASVRRQYLMRSVSERRRLQAELRQAQKMEAIGRLAGGVAHDFNNLLTVILGNVQIAERTARDERLRQDLAAIKDAAKRGARLTSQLLAFSRRQTVASEPLDLNEVVREIEALLRRVIREDIELEVRLAERLGAVTADRGQLEQVLVNLIVNAGDAMPQGGRLTISTAEEAGEIVLSVADTGVGMTEEVRARLFEPFFTTKKPGEGSGLGLSTVYGIVTGAGGRLVVESEPGRGSEFRVILPRTERVAAVEPPARPLVQAAAHGRVLLVEDDPAVRQVGSDLLRSLGYEVTEAGNGREAMGQLEAADAEPVDLVISDAVMPEMDGRELAERVRARWPAMPILLTSGHVGEGFEEGWMRALGVRFLPKPWIAERVAAEIEALRAGGADAA